MPELIPYGRHTLDEADVAAVSAVLRSDWLTTGPEVEAFEHALSDHVGASTIVVSSGTAALHCAYSACGIGTGAEVVTTPLTFIASVAPAVMMGARLRFADVTDDTLNIDIGIARELVTSATRALTVVDYAGHPCDLEEAVAVCRSSSLTLIEDASHSLGATYRGRTIGSVADLTTFSFHPVKAITTGEGGAIATTRPEFASLVRRFRNHGLIRNPSEFRVMGEGSWHQEVHDFGLNYRLPDILAALGRSQLTKLRGFIATRTRLAKRYIQNLSGIQGIRLPFVRPDVESGWHLFAVRILEGRRRAVYDQLRASGIGVQVHYLPLYMHPVLQDAGYRRGMCPRAEAAYSQLLTLPLYPGLTETEQDRVTDEVCQALS